MNRDRKILSPDLAKSTTEKPLKTGWENISEQADAENHLGSGQAFDETERPESRDDDNISDEKLDEELSNTDSRKETGKL